MKRKSSEDEEAVQRKRTHQLVDVSVIGCAGKQEEGKKMHACLFENMVQRARELLAELEVTPDRIRLVSGGAAWADHVAVALYLTGSYGGLVLHMPCEWDESKQRFLTNSHFHWSKNPGKLANMLHEQFSKRLHRNSLAEIEQARVSGVELITYQGFHQRNDVVARSSHLLAFTWSEEDSPPEKGGTRYTWNKAKGHRTHIPLHTLSNHQNPCVCRK